MNNATPTGSHSQTVVPLPDAPVTGSPVPHLTSIHSTPTRGPWGDWRYPGNCSGFLIRDLLRFFQPKSVFDPMSGSGTCADVCREIGIPCFSGDIHTGFDACDAAKYPKQQFDFIWLHPPYWRMKSYGTDPRCLSNAATATEFYSRLRMLVRACLTVLAPGGRIAILMGDYHDQRLGKIVPCVHLTKDICFCQDLWPACTDIIRFQHGNSSSHKHYTSSFIPGLHDVCMVFQRA